MTKKAQEMDRRRFLGGLALSASAAGLGAVIGAQASTVKGTASSSNKGARNMIVVTTPTGNIGEQVLANILDSGVPIRVIVRDPSSLPSQTRSRVEVVQGSHGDINIVTRAFKGADSVFWLCPPDPHAESVEAAYLNFTRPACKALRSQRVNRVVGVSALGRGTAMARKAGFVTASLAMDDMIASTGVSFRALTMPSFMHNILRQAEPIRNQGVFFSPISGDRKLPTCATRDIAAVAARVLLDPSWNGRGSVAVLGPEDLSFNDMARIMSEVLGKPVRFQQITGEAYKANLIKNGMSDAMAQGMLDMAMAKNEGLDNAEPRTPQSTTPTSFRQWCEEVLKPAVRG
jgi:uncharacterized protein YbjT (DUF2867 family)